MIIRYKLWFYLCGGSICNVLKEDWGVITNDFQLLFNFSVVIFASVGLSSGKFLCLLLVASRGFQCRMVFSYASYLEKTLVFWFLILMLTVLHFQGLNRVLVAVSFLGL